MGGSLRDALFAWSPKWLQGTVAAKYLYSFGYSLDVLLEKLNQGMRDHIPTYGDVSALPTIGNDLLISQGPTETPAGYALRLKTARDDWQHAGSAWSILRQLLGYMAPYQPPIRSVGQGLGTSVLWDYYPAGASTTQPPTHYAAASLNWNWDGNTTTWWRCWIVIDSTNGPFTCPKWGDGHKWGDGTAWGISGGSQTAVGLRAVVKQWKPADIQEVGIIVVYDTTEFTPTNPSFIGNPKGEYGTYYALSGGTAVPTHSSNASYLDGVT